VHERRNNISSDTFSFSVMDQLPNSRLRALGRSLLSLHKISVVCLTRCLFCPSVLIVPVVTRSFVAQQFQSCNSADTVLISNTGSSQEKWRATDPQWTWRFKHGGNRHKMQPRYLSCKKQTDYIWFLIFSFIHEWLYSNLLGPGLVCTFVRMRLHPKCLANTFLQV
jgi:hypothetical protein